MPDAGGRFKGISVPRRHGCCDHTRVLFNWLRYAEYVAAWDGVPLDERPGYTVVRDGDGWTAVCNA